MEIEILKKHKENVEKIVLFYSIPFIVTAKLLQLCLTLCNPRDGSPPGSPVTGILQTRTLEWVAISFSNAGKRKVKVKLLSHVRLLATPWTAAYQAPPSMICQARVLEWVAIAFSTSCMIKTLNTSYLAKHSFLTKQKVTFFPMETNVCV